MFDVDNARISSIVLGDYSNIRTLTNERKTYSYYDGFKHLAAGLCVGLCSLGAGVAIGIAGDAGVRALGKQNRLFVGMMLILIFAEALGLYGLIISLILASKN